MVDFAQLTATSELVVDLFLEEVHWLAGQFVQKTEQLFPTEQTVQTRVIVDKVFGAAENTLAGRIHLLMSR